jgi:hypothetical protein
MISINQNTIRTKYVAVLTKSIAIEVKADKLSELGRKELAAKEYAKCLKIEDQVLGKDHPLVKELKNKLTNKSGWEKTTQRKGMKALEQSFKNEKQADYLAKNEKEDLSVRAYEVSLRLEKAVLGSDHPVVASLREKILTIYPETSSKEVVSSAAKSEQTETVEVPTLGPATAPVSAPNASPAPKSASVYVVKKVDTEVPVALMKPPVLNQMKVVPMAA